MAIEGIQKDVTESALMYEKYFSVPLLPLSNPNSYCFCFRLYSIHTQIHTNAHTNRHTNKH